MGFCRFFVGLSTSVHDHSRLGRNPTIMGLLDSVLKIFVGDKSKQDLSQIPLSLIRKVDVLTGGKSTIYGSDAIGGVINFQLDRKFSGIKNNINLHFFV